MYKKNAKSTLHGFLARSYRFAAAGVLFCLCYIYFKPHPLSLSHSEQELLQSKTGMQTRSFVQKDLWIAQSSSERLHDRIESKESLLLLRPHQETMEIIETLQDVRGWVQERKQGEGPLGIQQVRYFTAQEGTYLYREQKFQAAHVQLSLYKLPESFPFAWIERRTPFLSGSAEEISFTLQEGAPRFQAYHFTASLQGTH